LKHKCNGLLVFSKDKHYYCVNVSYSVVYTGTDQSHLGSS